MHKCHCELSVSEQQFTSIQYTKQFGMSVLSQAKHKLLKSRTVRSHKVQQSFRSEFRVQHSEESARTVFNHSGWLTIKHHHGLNLIYHF